MIGFDFVNDAFAKVLDAVEIYRTATSGQINAIFITLIAIELLAFSILIIGRGGVNLYLTVRRLLIIGLISVAINNFDNLATVIGDAAFDLSTNENKIDPFTFENPGMIGNRGMFLANQIIVRSNESSGIFTWALQGFMDYFLALVLAFSYILLMIYVISIRLEYAIWSTIAFVTLPFAVFQPTSNFGQKGFIKMVNAAVSVYAVSLVLALGDPILSGVVLPDEWTLNDLFVQISVIGIYWVLVTRAGLVARSYHWGIPSANVPSVPKIRLPRGSLLRGSGAATSSKKGK